MMWFVLPTWMWVAILMTAIILIILKIRIKNGQQ